MSTWWRYFDAEGATRLGEAEHAKIRAAAGKMRADGAKFWRVTVVDARHNPLPSGATVMAGFWLEGDVEPVDGPFEPPLELAT